jgi:hypothetical protein
VFVEVAMHVGAARGSTSERGGAFGEAHLDIKREDPVKLALASDLQKSALANVSGSSCGKYTSQFNMLVAWSDALAES